MEEIEGNRIDLAVLERMLTRNPVPDDETDQNRTAEDDGATRIPDGSTAVVESRHKANQHLAQDMKTEPKRDDETNQNRTAEDDGATRIPDGSTAVVESRQVTGVEPETKPEPGQVTELEPETKAESKPQMKAKIVDIPFARWDPPPDPPTGCKHEKSDGRRCGKAIWQNGMCGVHGEWHNTMAAALGLPFPDDQMSLHRFLLKTLDMVVSGKLQARQALAVEGICKMIFKNIRTGGFEM